MIVNDVKFSAPKPASACTPGVHRLKSEHKKGVAIARNSLIFQSFIQRFRMGLNLNMRNQMKFSEIIRNSMSVSYDDNLKNMQLYKIR